MRRMWPPQLLLLLLLLGIFRIAAGRSIVRRDTLANSFEPNFPEEPASEHLVREKRHQDVKFGVKNALIGFVFNPSSVASNKASRAKSQATTPRPSTTTPDIVIFEKHKPVSLEVPDQLFGSSFTLVTNLSETVGDFMINSAMRAQRLLESMRPFLRALFGVKGIVIDATDDSKPIFSDGSNSNDV